MNQLNFTIPKKSCLDIYFLCIEYILYVRYNLSNPKCNFVKGNLEKNSIIKRQISNKLLVRLDFEIEKAIILMKPCK